MSFQKLMLAALALALCGIVPASAGTTVYPPTNMAAGGGLLYFPQGGNSSLYAVPVISDSLTAAVQAQTAQQKATTEAIEKQTASIDELKEAMQKSSGAIQCNVLSINQIACVNVVTGTICYLDNNDNFIRWNCSGNGFLSTRYPSPQ